MNIFEKALNFVTSGEILANTSWSVDYINKLFCLENNDYFLRDEQEFIYFCGYVNWGGKEINIRGDMNRFIPGVMLSKEIDLFITFDNFVAGMNLDWLYKTSHLSFEELDTDHYPFIKIPVSKFILEGYDVEIMIFAERDGSVTGFRAAFIKQI